MKMPRLRVTSDQIRKTEKNGWMRKEKNGFYKCSYRRDCIRSKNMQTISEIITMEKHYMDRPIKWTKD